MEKHWLNKSVFVTGVTGLLGSWLAGELVDRGAHVVSLVRDAVPRARVYHDGIASSITMVHGQLEDSSLLERTLNEYEVESVFHLAAQTIVPIANANPLSTFESNIKGTWTLLEACRRTPRIRTIVVASSDKAYGEQKNLPYTEHMALEGSHPYDVSKSCADLISRMYGRHYGLPVCVTRCGNLFGGGDLNFNRIVPGTIRSVLLGERPVIRSNGRFIRDYFYVRDAATAYLVLAEKMEHQDMTGQAFNFGNDTPVSVLQIAGEILTLMGRSDLEPVVLNQASGEIPEQYLSSAKAREMLGWRPSYTLSAGLAETIEWYRNYFQKTAR
ncbi:MAG: GDP-mannose 4,6-dehydratase [Thermodesulfovibrionales bacterium]